MQHDRLDELARLAVEFVNTRGSEAVYTAWRDNMLEQGREVIESRMNYENLSAIDKELDELIAFDILHSFLTFISSK